MISHVPLSNSSQRDFDLDSSLRSLTMDAFDWPGYLSPDDLQGVISKPYFDASRHGLYSSMIIASGALLALCALMAGLTLAISSLDMFWLEMIIASSTNNEYATESERKAAGTAR